MLLQKLGTNSWKNKLYKAFRELGRVIRTIFLLEFISDKNLRMKIRADTTKIESFHAFHDWVTFGGHTITSGDPVEQAKRNKYIDLVANVVMLHNAVDLTHVLHDLAKSGEEVTLDLAKYLSPYMNSHIKRFGKYNLDMDDLPEPLQLPKLEFI
jgi:TnpA family transposase